MSAGLACICECACLLCVPVVRPCCACLLCVVSLPSMARMYTWSPDECIPAFYLDPDVLLSLNKDEGLPDIGEPRCSP